MAIYAPSSAWDDRVYYEVRIENITYSGKTWMDHYAHVKYLAGKYAGMTVAFKCSELRADLGVDEIVMTIAKLNLEQAASGGGERADG